MNGPAFSALWAVALGLLVLSCVAALFLRFRRAVGIEREQIKGLLYACAVFAVVFLIGVFLHQEQAKLINTIWGWLFSLSIVAIPIAIAIAVLRYRLWDINLIINRTLVYVPMTAFVAGIFSAAISLSQKAFLSLTGQDSLASTVIATLIVVALFNPIKDRVQRTVDKRFKETPSPSKRLNAFQERLRARVSEVQVGPLTWRFLEEVVAAFDAESGIACLEQRGHSRQIRTIGSWEGDERMSAKVKCGGTKIGSIGLGGRREGRDYAEVDRKVLQQAADAVGKAIEEDCSIRQAIDPLPAGEVASGLWSPCPDLRASLPGEA